MKSMMMKTSLNKSLLIFFKDALRITVKNPMQAYSFVRTLFWLRKAAQIRAILKNQAIHVPPIIIFSITNQCNLTCQGCYAKSFHQQSNNELSAEKLRSITEQAKMLGVSFFVLAGGEPFMRPEIMDIMKSYPEIIFMVFTNGLLIDDSMIRKLKKQKNVVPLISLEGDEHATDKRRGDGVFKSVHSTMNKMRKNDIFFGTSLTLTTMNFTTITSEDYIKNLVRVGCKFFIYLEYTPTVEDTESWILDAEQREQIPSLMNYYRQKYPALFIAVPWDEDDVGGCLSAGRGFIHINAKGDLEPCPFAPFSDTNVRDMSLKEALQSKFFETVRQIPELSRETGGGCVLWKERELVQSLLNKEY